MFKLLRNKKGQGHGVQYAMSFILIVASLMAMGVYMRRAVQAKIRDTRMHMMREVSLAQPNVTVQVEYEPYYMQTEGVRAIDSTQTRRTTGSGAASTGIYQLDLNDRTASNSYQNQLPPKLAY